jgi:hypothetical protein
MITAGNFKFEISNLKLYMPTLHSPLSGNRNTLSFYTLYAICYSLCAFATMCLCAYPENIHHSLINNDDIWRVSADTKTCGSPLYLAPTGLRPDERAVCVSLLANMCILYQIYCPKSSELSAD